MARMIAARTIVGYRAARLEYDNDDVIKTLETAWVGRLAIHSLVAGGDMLSLRKHAAMRVVNRSVTRHAETLQELIAIANAENIHRLSIHDESGKVFDEYADWNMTCEAGEDLFIENIATSRPWYHVIDGTLVQQISNQKAA